VVKAQRTLQDLLVGDQRLDLESLLTEADLLELRLALESDSLFRQQFDADPIAAAKDAGNLRLALGLEREMRELIAFAERIATDSTFNIQFEADPATTLAASGMPMATHEPLLRALDVSDDALARLPEVVAHRHEQSSVRAGLVLLLLGTTAAAQELRATPRAT
jgi:hypothetical protein